MSFYAHIHLSESMFSTETVAEWLEGAGERTRMKRIPFARLTSASALLASLDAVIDASTMAA